MAKSLADEKLVIGDTNVIALTAVTLVLELIKTLIDDGQLSRHKVRKMIDDAVKIHLQTPAGQSEINREVAAALRMIADDALPRE